MEQYINKVTCADCMDVLREIPDNSIDLVLTDPPYGLNKKWNGGSWNTRKAPTWDVRIERAIFVELFRISRHQIIWGGNYYTDYLCPSMGWIAWLKQPWGNDQSDFELAWTSFDKATRIFIGNICLVDMDGRKHPTQKPLKLFRWLIQNWSNPNDIILDPFLGSGTTAVACKQLGRRFIGIEINPEYCRIAEERLKQEVLPLQEKQPDREPKQEAML